MGVNFLPQRLPQGMSDRLGRTVAATGLTPNIISCIGLAGNGLAAWLIIREQLLPAGLVFLFFSLLDMVDGAVARATGQATPFGAVLDAVFDRLGEAVILAGMAWYFADRGEQVQVAVTFAAVLGSISVSYLRARAGPPTARTHLPRFPGLWYGSRASPPVTGSRDDGPPSRK